MEHTHAHTHGDKRSNGLALAFAAYIKAQLYIEEGAHKAEDEKKDFCVIERGDEATTRPRPRRSSPNYNKAAGTTYINTYIITAAGA